MIDPHVVSHETLTELHPIKQGLKHRERTIRELKETYRATSNKTRIETRSKQATISDC